MRAAPRSRRPQSRLERAQAPDAPEVVHRQHLLDALGIDVEVAPAGRDPGVVHEERDGGMPLEDPRRDRVHRLAIGHVADLPLRAELPRHGRQAVLPPREQDRAPPPPRQLARRHLADPRGRPRHDRYTSVAHPAASLIH